MLTVDNLFDYLYVIYYVISQYFKRLDQLSLKQNINGIRNTNNAFLN